MLKKLFKLAVIILMFVGIFSGMSITVKRLFPNIEKKEAESNVLNQIQSSSAELTSFYTYGRAFNISGKIANITEDNFESIKMVITDGLDFEKTYNLNYEFSGNDLLFSSATQINDGIIIDKLESSKYYILIRLKSNNSINPRYYSFADSSSSKDFDYYTVTKDGLNRKAEIKLAKVELEKNEYNLLTINFTETELPENIYDIVIDAGHGGKDTGEKSGDITEADISLEYANLLKQSLEKEGFKVKLTRDENNSSSYTYNNMYDKDGRITVACESRAKLMISFHLNNGDNSLSGFEIYCPCKSNFNLAESMASNIKKYSNINYSNSNAFKKNDGVYLRNFTKNEINASAKTSESKGFAPYNITTETPYLYTIREVGGIATGAYADGRNAVYAKNEYYDSTQGIECYQIELGYIKTDLDTIINEKENYIRGITEAIVNYNN